MREFDVLTMPQRSPEWYAARLGRLTGSRAEKMLAKTKSGGYSTGRENLKWDLVLEQMTGRSMESTYQSAAMAQGVEREALAVGAFEAHAGVLVQFCGFLSHRRLMTGASLDGYLGDFETLVSVKCREPKAHAEHILNGAIPAGAMAQMRHELWLTGAASHLYVSFNPDFPEPLQLRVVPVSRASLDVDGYAAEVARFLDEVARGVADLRKAAA